MATIEEAKERLKELAIIEDRLMKEREKYDNMSFREKMKSFGDLEGFKIRQRALLKNYQIDKDIDIKDLFNEFIEMFLDEKIKNMNEFMKSKEIKIKEEK